MDIPFVPITMRDYFFHDPFFRRTWYDFDDVYDAASFLAPTDPWRSFDEDFRNMACLSSNMLRQMLDQQPTLFKPRLEREVPMEVGKPETRKELEKEVEEASKEKTLAETGKEKPSTLARTLFPRRWMVPAMRTEFDKFGLFQEEDTQLIRQKVDEGFMEVTLDTSNYRPDELKVLQNGDCVCIEGKHEERSPDGNRFNYRQFQRRFRLPEGAQEVSSNLSSDGVLVVQAGHRTAEPKEKMTEEKTAKINP